MKKLFETTVIIGAVLWTPYCIADLIMGGNEIIDVYAKVAFLMIFGPKLVALGIFSVGEELDKRNDQQDMKDILGMK